MYQDYDSISAAEILSPLTRNRLGGNIDVLVSKAVYELDVFKPRLALKHIVQLMDACEKSERQSETEGRP